MRITNLAAKRGTPSRVCNGLIFRQTLAEGGRKLGRLVGLPGRLGGESWVHRHPLKALPVSTVTSSKEQSDSDLFLGRAHMWVPGWGWVTVLE